VKKVKYLIVGAGISGLSFANFIASDDYLILEKEKEAGGFCRTIYKKDYVWDYAGHFFHFTNNKIKRYFNNKIQKDQLIYKKKNTKIFYKGDYIDYPFQKNIHQLSKVEFVDCLYDIFNKNEKINYYNFEEMLYGKFGKSITNKFLKPYNEKLYSCHLNSLDADAMGRFFPYANIKEIIDNMKLQNDNSYNNEFMYPKGGAAIFVIALLNELDQEKILYNQEIYHIDTIKKIAETSQLQIKYQYLINTAPFDRLIEFINRDEYINTKTILTYNKVLVLNLGFDKKSSIDDVHWVYVPDKNINFYRIGFYDNILSSDKLSMYIEISYPSSIEVEVDKQLRFTLDNLKKMKIINDHKLLAYSSVIMSPAYIHISKVGQSFKERRKRELEKYNIYTIGRYGDWKYCSIEDSMIDAINMAKKLNCYMN